MIKNRIKVLRAEKNWTQEDLAKRVGVSRQTINSIERGKFFPSVVLALKIARVFNLKVEDIFYLVDEEEVNDK